MKIKYFKKNEIIEALNSIPRSIWKDPIMRHAGEDKLYICLEHEDDEVENGNDIVLMEDGSFKSLLQIEQDKFFRESMDELNRLLGE